MCEASKTVRVKVVSMEDFYQPAKFDASLLETPCITASFVVKNRKSCIIIY